MELTNYTLKEIEVMTKIGQELTPLLLELSYTDDEIVDIVNEEMYLRRLPKAFYINSLYIKNLKKGKILMNSTKLFCVNDIFGKFETD